MLRRTVRWLRCPAFHIAPSIASGQREQDGERFPIVQMRKVARASGSRFWPANFCVVPARFLLQDH